MAKKPTMEAAMLAATAVLALTRKQRDAVEKMLVAKREKEDAAKDGKVAGQPGPTFELMGATGLGVNP